MTLPLSETGSAWWAAPAGIKHGNNARGKCGCREGCKEGVVWCGRRKEPGSADQRLQRTENIAEEWVGEVCGEEEEGEGCEQGAGQPAFSIAHTVFPGQARFQGASMGRVDQVHARPSERERRYFSAESNAFRRSC